MSQITNIPVRHENQAQLRQEYMLEGVVASNSTVSTFLINMITSWTQYNSKKCAHTLIYDVAQLILVFSSSRMPGPRAVTRLLTNSHIFPSSAHMTIIFTDIETQPCLLSFYVHSILLCCPPLMSARLC